MKIVIGNYPSPLDSRNLILNDGVIYQKTKERLSPLYALVQKITGLDSAEYRNGTGNWSGADGGYISSQLYGARTIVINGEYIDKQTICDFSNLKDEQFDRAVRFYLRSRLPIRTKLAIRIFLDTKMVFYTEGYCTDFKMDYETFGHGPYQITMYCPEPALYRGAADGSMGSDWQTTKLYKEKDVGYANPAEMHFDEDLPDHNHGIKWTTGGRSAPIDYHGDYFYYPEIIVNGPIINPEFRLMETGQKFSLGHDPETVCKIEVTGTTPSGIVDEVTPLYIGRTYRGRYNSSDTTDPTVNAQVVGGSGTGMQVILGSNPTELDDFYALQTILQDRIQNRGTGYAVNDIVKVVVPEMTSDHQPAYLVVTEVDEDGAILALSKYTNGFYGEAMHPVPGGYELEGDNPDSAFDVDLTAFASATSVGTWYRVATSKTLDPETEEYEYRVSFYEGDRRFATYREDRFVDLKDDIEYELGITVLVSESSFTFSENSVSAKWTLDPDTVGTLEPLTGSGSGAEVGPDIEYVSGLTEDGYTIELVAISDGGSGYEVGDVVDILPRVKDKKSYESGICFMPYNSQFEVTKITEGGAITELAIVSGGSYDIDYTAQGVDLLNADISEGVYGKANLVMSQNENGKWELTNVSLATDGGGYNYKVGDILTPSITGDSIFSITKNQTLKIDMMNRTATVDGASRSYFISSDSEWFALQPQRINHIVFTSDGAKDTETALIRWRNAYQGI